MRYDTRLGKYDGKARHGGMRSTLCVSSQVAFGKHPDISWEIFFVKF